MKQSIKECKNHHIITLSHHHINSLLAIVVLFITGCHSHEADNHADKSGDVHANEIIFTKQQAETVGLEIQTVTPGIFHQVIKTSGQIQTPQGDEVSVVATSNGIVSFANPSITEGTAIKSGQTLVTISSKNLPEGNPAITVKNEYETAFKEYQRAEKLAQDKIISDKELEQIRLRYETAKNRYEAQASYRTSTGTRVTAPISGYLKNRWVSQGEYVSVGQPIATLSQNRRLQLKAEVAESYFKDLKNISSANFKLSYDDTVYKLSDLNGRLLSFGKTSDSQSFYIPVTFELDNVGDIIPGSFAEVFLISLPQNDVIAIPISAVTEEQGLHFVYLQLDEEGYEKQEVTLGTDDGERVQALSGLKSGDRIVTRGVYQVKLAANASVVPEGHTHSH